MKRDLVVASTWHNRARLLKYYPRRPCVPSFVKSRILRPLETHFLLFQQIFFVLVCIHPGTPRVPPRVWPLGQNPAGAITARSVWIQGWYSQKQYYWFSVQFSILWKGIHSLTLRRSRLIHLWRIVPGTRFSSGCPRSAQLVVCKHQSKTFAQRGNTDDLPHAWYTCDSPMPGMFPGSTDSSVASMWFTRDLGARPTLDSLV